MLIVTTKLDPFGPKLDPFGRLSIFKGDEQQKRVCRSYIKTLVQSNVMQGEFNQASNGHLFSECQELHNNGEGL